jgi:hypothetical protein
MLQLADLPISDNSQLALGTLLNQTVVSPSHLPLPIRDFLDISYPFTGKVSHLSHYLFGAGRVPLLISPFLTIAGWINNYGPLITIRSGTERIAIIGRHKVSPSRRVVSCPSSTFYCRPQWISWRSREDRWLIVLA